MRVCDQSSWFLGGVCVANPGQTELEPPVQIPSVDQIDQRDWQSDKQTNKLTRTHNIWIRSNWKTVPHCAESVTIEAPQLFADRIFGPPPFDKSIPMIDGRANLSECLADSSKGSD